MRRLVFNKKFNGLKLLSAVLCFAALTFTGCSKDYDDDISDLQSQINEQSTTISSLSAQLTTLNSALEQEKANLTTLDAKLTAAIEAAKTDAKNDDAVVLAAAQKAAAEAQAAAIADAAKKVADLKSTLESEIQEMVKSQDKKLADAIAVVELAHKKDIDSVKADIVAINSSISKLTTDLNNFEIAQKATNTDLQNQITANKNTITALDKAYKDADAQLQKKIDDVNAALKVLNETTIPGLQKQITENASNITDLQKLMKAANDSITKLNKVVAGLGDDIATLNVLVTVRPTTMTFKPMNYRNGIEALVFEPVNYFAKHNKDNVEVTATGNLEKYSYLDFPEKDSYPYENVITAWINKDYHYVKMPAEVCYYINPSGATINEFDIDKASFKGNYATTRSASDSEDMDNVMSINYNSYYTPIVENNTLKFRVNMKGAYVKSNGYTKDYYKDFGWKYATNEDNYIGRVDTATVWEEQAKALTAGYSGTDRGFSYVFASDIPLKGAALAEGETSANVFSDYAVVTSEVLSSSFSLCKNGAVKTLYNPNKADAYVLEGTGVGQQKPVYTGTKANIIYDLYNAAGKGFDPAVENSLADFMGIVEYDTDPMGGKREYQVSNMRLEDLGFQYRFYVPTFEGATSADESSVKYKGPHYGPYEYYFGASTIDFQNNKYLNVDAKTGKITITNWDVCKGFAPVVLCQVVDTRRPHTPVVTESYFRVVIKGEEVNGSFEKTDFPRCNNDTLLLVCPYSWLKKNVYDKFNITKDKFVNYFEPAFTTKATTGTKMEWINVTNTTNPDLCVSIPYNELKGLNDEALKDFKSVIVGKLGGNIVTLNFAGHVGLPKIELSYQNAYWIDYPSCTKMVGNPRPFSELTYSDYASYDLNLLSGFNTTNTASGYAQEGATGIYFKATFQGATVTSKVTCTALDIVPVTFAKGDGAESYILHNNATNSYKALYANYNSYMGTKYPFAAADYKTNHEAFQYRPDKTAYASYYVSDYNIELTENAYPAINQPAGSSEAIRFLRDSVSIPVQVWCTYSNGDIKVLKEFSLSYRMPIFVKTANTQHQFKDILHTEQAINVRDLITLVDWRGADVAPYAVNTKGTTPTPEALSYYYGVQDPVFDMNGTKLNVRTNLAIDKTTGNLVPQDGVTNGPLPDGVTVVLENAGTINAKLIYQNSGKELTQEYKMYIDVTISHKWGAIYLDGIKHGKADGIKVNEPVTIVVKPNI